MYPLKPWLPFLLAFALLVCACAPSVSAEPAHLKGPSGSLEAFTHSLDADLPGLLERYRVPGATIALVVDGRLAWSQGYGLADRENNLPATPETVYQVASISKTVAAWGVMRLVEQGKLDLDAPVGRYLTRWSLPPSAYDPQGVTVRRLLSHTAGLSVHGYPGYAPDAPLPSLEESLNGFLGDSYAVSQMAEPGTIFNYSGGGYTLLELLVEEVSGQTFADYMHSEVLSPLGLAHSGYDWRSDLRPRTAGAYDIQGQRLPNYLFTEKAAAGLYTTAGDLATFGAAFFAGTDGQPAGRGVLAPTSLETIGAVVLSIPPETLEGYLSGMDGYGLGVYVETLPDGSRWLSHSGSNKGWRSLLVVAPAQRTALTVLTNSDNGSAFNDAILSRWAGWLGVGTPRRLRNMDTLSTILAIIIALLLLGFALWLVRFLRRARRSGLRFCLRWRSLPGLLGGLLLAGSWLAAGSALVWALFPLLAHATGLAVLLWALALGVSALTAPPHPPLEATLP